jgi:hypothetical protein
MTDTSAQVGTYVGEGGILLHLDESKPGMPADPLMAKQLAKGTLRRADDTELEADAKGEVVHGRPATSASVGQWRDWAITQGLAKYEAEGMSKKALLLWADQGGTEDPDSAGVV